VDPLSNRAFRWTSAGMQNLGTLPGDSFSAALAISGDGSAVAGSSTLGSNPRAFRWTAALGMQNLGTLGGSTATAYAVSANGLAVAGESKTASGATHAFRWRVSDGMKDLGTLGGTNSHARAISGDGTAVVGFSFAATGGSRAFLWSTPLGMVDLNTYLPTQGINLTGWVLTEATGLSASGTAIAGVSSVSISGIGTLNGLARGFLVTIVPDPVCGTADFDGDGDAGTDADIEAFFRRLGGGTCAP